MGIYSVYNKEEKSNVNQNIDLSTIDKLMYKCWSLSILLNVPSTAKKKSQEICTQAVINLECCFDSKNKRIAFIHLWTKAVI